MSQTWRVFFALLVFLFICGEVSRAEDAFVAPDVKNGAALAAQLQVNSVFKGKKFSRKVKVAVFDNGWTGYQGAIGKSLPAGTVFHNGEASAADEGEDVNFHGVVMAKILYAVLKESGAELDIDLHLFNTYGYTKLKSAVNEAIEGQFDLVLYSQVWEFGGNGDGKGFINAQVDRAVKAGIVWINAAGNFGKSTILAPVDFREKKAKFTCASRTKEPCVVKLVVAWNDFNDDPTLGTEKDMDVEIADKDGKIVAESKRKQRLRADATDKLVTLLPRELIETKLPVGTYEIRIKVNTDNFSAERDQVRINLSGSGLTLANPTTAETLLPPAENEGVITVGASDDPQSSKSKKAGKPEVMLRSLVELDNGSKPFASSNAAALASAAAVLYIGMGQAKTKAEVLAKLKLISRQPEAAIPVVRAAPRPAGPRRPVEEPVYSGSASPYTPRFQPERSPEDETRCLEPITGVRLFAYAQDLVDLGGVLRSRDGRLLIRIPPNMAERLGLRGMEEGRRFVVTPSGFRAWHPADGENDEAIEIRLTRFPKCL